MKKELYKKIEKYMLGCMKDSAHDKEHIYRVLFMALDIAKNEENIDDEVLITACLLHDIGREAQFKNPSLCHAEVGGEMAYSYLKEIGFSEEKANHVKSCIKAHRFRPSNEPQSLEAKILFDADKIDVTGAIGIARTLFYQGHVGIALYGTDENGKVINGENNSVPSFFREYKYKLEKVYDKFYTKGGRIIAEERQEAAVNFYNSMLKEINDSYEKGNEALNNSLDN